MLCNFTKWQEFTRNLRKAKQAPGQFFLDQCPEFLYLNPQSGAKNMDSEWLQLTQFVEISVRDNRVEDQSA
jgi:hypothetical protein